MRIKSRIYESATEFWACSNLIDEQFLYMPFLTTEFAERTQNNDHYAAQGHSRSPIFVPIESSYATSY